MGFFRKLFNSGETSRPGGADDGASWTAVKDGQLVMQARESIPITGRSVVMIGETLVPIAVDQWCAVTNGGAPSRCASSPSPRSGATNPSFHRPSPG